MNTRTSSIIVFILTALLFAGCSKEPQPSKSDIEQSLTTQLPAFARISSLSVDAMQNLGTKVEPAWQARFRATIKVASDTFVADGMDSGVTFVRPVKRAGETTEIFGKSVSSLYAGAWHTALEFDGQPIPALGMPESAFAPNKVIVRGSKAETDYLAEQAEMKRAAAQREVERIRAESQAEAERLRAAAEAKAERQKVEEQILADQRRAEAERVSAAAKAEAERRRVEEQILADQRREAEQQGERRLQVWLTPGSSFSGNRSGYDQPDIRIVFVSVDTAQRTLKGHADWSYDSQGNIPVTYTFEGRWVGGTISATGTKVTPESVQINGLNTVDPTKNARKSQCNLTLTAGASGRLEGTICGDKISFTK